MTEENKNESDYQMPFMIVLVFNLALLIFTIILANYFNSMLLFGVIITANVATGIYLQVKGKSGCKHFAAVLILLSISVGPCVPCFLSKISH